ncbi:hypothetical protein BTO30_15020 [Domibacillus antri]|uniref:Uncharacterized protein n=1 Tax=Domibacillus antri TaxID=1714264 RepID=A0A1Q8Q255_9BACI|nr:hypothetical protein [Domibacillus antri]OLN21426.1 hypothetical protein BTO30_15020 [Domibacillus antri]
MDLIIQKPIFNPDLQGMMVLIQGADARGLERDGVFYVRNAFEHTLNVRDIFGKAHELNIEDFEEKQEGSSLVLKVLPK